MAASGDTAIGESGQSRLQIPVDKGQRSRVACLPKLQEDVTRILNTSVPGCILPKFGHANVRNHTAPNEEDCDVAARLYHEDFEIWRAHCGN